MLKSYGYPFNTGQNACVVTATNLSRDR